MEALQEKQRISRGQQLMKKRNLLTFQNDILQRQRQFDQRVINPLNIKGNTRKTHFIRNPFHMY